MRFDKAKRTLKAYSALNEDERAEFIEKLNEYIRASDADKRKILNEEFMVKSAHEILGPRGNTCPYCGR